MAKREEIQEILEEMKEKKTEGSSSITAGT
jgi:hypothetical protein